MAFIFALSAPRIEAADDLQRVVLQLSSFHSFRFAGYYAAREKGYYWEAGLDVDIREATPDINPIRQVVNGSAQYGVGAANLLLARYAGLQVVALAAIQQYSPLVLIVRQNQATPLPQNLAGKRILLGPNSNELLVYLRQQGASLESIFSSTENPASQELINGRADAISGNITQEPYYLTQAGVPFQLYTSRSVGIDFYGDNLFTSEGEIDQHPDQVEAFREATLRGWRYAIRHPQEIAALINAHYSQKKYPLDFYQYQADQMRTLIQPELVEIGYMNPARWEYIAQVYASLGLMPQHFDLKGFLYQSNTPIIDRTWLSIGAVLLLLAALITIYSWYINRRLRQALHYSQQAEQALRISEERLHLLADNITEVLWTLDLQGKCTYMSPSVFKLRGYSAAETMRQSLDEALVPQSTTTVRRQLRKILGKLRHGKDVPDLHTELEQPCRNGSTVWIEVKVSAMRNRHGAYIGLLGMSRNISNRRQAEQKIRHMAQHDSLTDLPNWALFSEHLQQALAVAQREQHGLAILFINLNHFRLINDNHGHATGDRLLQDTARRIQACLYTVDTLAARIGGDEFVVLLSKVNDRAEALMVAKRISRSLGIPFLLDGMQLQISCRIGIALFPEHGRSERELCKHADQAIYARENPMHDQVCIYGEQKLEFE